MILALAVGNSNLRYARIDEHGLLCPLGVVRLESGPSTAVAAVEMAELAEAEGLRHVIAVSVRPDFLREIEQALGHRGLNVQLAGRDFEVPIVNRYARPQDVGVDRLVVVLGATRRHPGVGVVVVDFGTALTVNVGSPRGEFLGGLIGLGLGSARRALSAQAPRLPPVEIGEPDGFVARDTPAAIRDGLLWQVVGGVERMLEGVRQSCDFPLRVLATGGDASLVTPWIRGVNEVVPDLLLEGLAHAHSVTQGID